VPPPGGVAPGAEVTISLRPEAVRLGVPPSDAPNVFDAVVRESVYLGELAQHQVALRPANGARDGIPPIKVFELHPRFLAGGGAGDTRAWFDPRDVVLLK
jgi:ABC-type Fe3+/spermidine/putrescine transport system ATPase subunit